MNVSVAIPDLVFTKSTDIWSLSYLHHERVTVINGKWGLIKSKSLRAQKEIRMIPTSFLYSLVNVHPKK